MDENSAMLVFFAIMALGLIVWLCSLMWALRIGRANAADWRTLTDPLQDR
jgi:hypothetical protein